MSDHYQNNAIQKYQFKHHFVPHPHHKTRATLLSVKALWVYSALILLFILAIRITPSVAPGVLGYASNINTQDLLNETNKMRTDRGLNSLSLNPQLNAAAQKKAEHMFEEDYWAHISPSGVKPWDFILGSGYDYQYAGENLAKNFNSSDQVVTAWYNSKSHRENLLSDKYDEIGFAVVNGVLDGVETTLVVQMFGTARGDASIAAIPPTLGTETQIDPVPTEQVVQEQPLPSEQTTPLLEEQVLNEPQPNPQRQITPVTVVNTGEVNSASSSFFLDINNLTKTLVGVFVGFMLTLLVIDIWYSRKHGIPKFTGHTVAHITFLLLILLSMWFVISPGSIL